MTRFVTALFAACTLASCCSAGAPSREPTPQDISTLGGRLLALKSNHDDGLVTDDEWEKLQWATIVEFVTNAGVEGAIRRVSVELRDLDAARSAGAVTSSHFDYARKALLARWLSE